MALLTILGVTKKLYSYRLILERKIGKEVPQSLRLEFLEKFLENILLYQMQKTTLPGQKYLYLVSWKRWTLLFY